MALVSERSSREDVEDWKVLEGGDGDEENEGEGSFADSAAHSMLLFGGQREEGFSFLRRGRRGGAPQTDLDYVISQVLGAS